MNTMHDEYAEAVHALVEAKTGDKAPPEPAEPDREEAGTVTDLMSALKTAADRARADRGQDADVHHMAGRTPAKKATAKKATAKKAMAKKTAAKTTGAKKTTRKRAG
jgi:DNA end-binding protein Ku